jgi:hypothetical protein
MAQARAAFSRSPTGACLLAVCNREKVWLKLARPIPWGNSARSSEFGRFLGIMGWG